MDAPLVDLADALADLADDGVDRERTERAEPVDGVGLEVELAGSVAEQLDQRVVDDRQDHRGEQVGDDGAVADEELADHGPFAGGIDGTTPVVGGEPTGPDQCRGQGLVSGLVAGEVQLASVQVDRAAGWTAEPCGTRPAVCREDLEDACGGEVLKCSVERHSDPRPLRNGVVPIRNSRPEQR